MFEDLIFECEHKSILTVSSRFKFSKRHRKVSIKPHQKQSTMVVALDMQLKNKTITNIEHITPKEHSVETPQLRPCITLILKFNKNIFAMYHSMD